METNVKHPISSHIILGTLKMIPEDERSSSWILSAGSATSFTDVDFGAWVPQGVRALLLSCIVRLSGDGALDEGLALLRPNGSSETSNVRLARVEIHRLNLTTGLTAAISVQATVLCDRDGIIEYQVNDAAVDLWLNVIGYYL